MQAFIVENGFVTQSIMVPNADWPVQEGQSLVLTDVGQIGWKLEGGQLIRPVDDFISELANLNAVYQKDVEDFNRTFSLAILNDGPTEEAKKVNIRAQYAARKAAYSSDLIALRNKHGV